jgi:hypothetical protein
VKVDKAPKLGKLELVPMDCGVLHQSRLLEACGITSHLLMTQAGR